MSQMHHLTFLPICARIANTIFKRLAQVLGSDLSTAHQEAVNRKTQVDADLALLRSELDVVTRKNGELLQQLDAQTIKTTEAEQQGHRDAQLIKDMSEEAGRLQVQLTAADEPAIAAQHAQLQQQHQIGARFEDCHACDDPDKVSVKLHLMPTDLSLLRGKSPGRVCIV